LAHRCHGFPIHDVAHELSLHHSNVLADDRYAVLHRGHSDDHLCVNELHRHDAVHLTADALDDHRNCVRDLDGRHHHVDDLDANHDLQTCHQLMDVQMMDVPNLDDQMTDDRDRLDDHHRRADATDDLNQNCVDDLDGRHCCADAMDDLNQNCVDAMDDHHHYVDVPDGHHHCVVEKVVNRHDEGLWLQRHLGVLDGLNHYLVLGDADRFCLV
jgi:hypothetical protein